MLQDLVECKLPADFIIIEDSEEHTGYDIFVSFLTYLTGNEQTKIINLICYENPPEYYLLNDLKNSKKITQFNFFSDPCNWKNSSVRTFDSIIPSDLSEEVFFLDSLFFLSKFYGFYSTFEKLSLLKKVAKKVICLAHRDLFSLDHLEELKFLTSALITIQEDFRVISNQNNCREKSLLLVYKKLGGKIITQEEVVLINNEFQILVSNKLKKKSEQTSLYKKNELKNLTTFKLGIEMSENEKKAKDQLVLPYLKTNKTNTGGGQIIYYPEAEFDLEDDPDDDLNI